LEVSTAPWKHMGEWSYGSTIIDLRSSWRWELRHKDAWGSEAMDLQLLTSLLVGGEHCAMKTQGGSESMDPQLLTAQLVGGEHCAMKTYGEWIYGPTIIDLRSRWRWALRHEGLWGSETMDPHLFRAERKADDSTKLRSSFPPRRENSISNSSGIYRVRNRLLSTSSKGEHANTDGI
jgi:hypothetical protein